MVSRPPGLASYNRLYDLDGGSRKKEIDVETGETKSNPWHDYCKSWATDHNVSYAAAISMASQDWEAHKIKNGLKFRPRKPKKKPGEQEEEGGRKLKSLPLPGAKEKAPTQKQRKPREPAKNRNRKGQGKRGREEEGSYDYSISPEPRRRERERDTYPRERREPPSCRECRGTEGRHYSDCPLRSRQRWDDEDARHPFTTQKARKREREDRAPPPTKRRRADDEYSMYASEEDY